MVKIPREGTRVRAVFDKLLNDYNRGLVTTWGGAHSAYCYHENPSMGTRILYGDSAKHASMELSRVLKKYANKVDYGRYVIKNEFIEKLIIESAPRRSSNLDVVDTTDALEGRLLAIEDIKEIHRKMNEKNEYIKELEKKKSIIADSRRIAGMALEKTHNIENVLVLQLGGELDDLSEMLIELCDTLDGFND